MATIVTVLKGYFGHISVAEMKKLSTEERRELAELAAVELGMELDPPPAPASPASGPK